MISPKVQTVPTNNETTVWAWPQATWITICPQRESTILGVGLEQCFFFRQPVHFGDYFLSAKMYIFPTAFWGKTPKKFSSALLWTLFDAKNTLLGSSVRRYENQKTFPLVFSSSLFVLARAARRNFHFFPGIFRLKQSQNEDRGVWNLKNLRFF